jgi:hypothetical protein
MHPRGDAHDHVTEGDALRLVSEVRGCLVIASPRLFISTIEGEPTVEGSRAQSLYAKTLLDKPSRSVGCLVVLGPSTGPPAPTVRKEIMNRLLEIAPFASGLAMVIEADGFRGAALRGVFTSFLMVRRLPYQAEVFRSTREALDWLARGLRIDPASAQVALARIRRDHPITSA